MNARTLLRTAFLLAVLAAPSAALAAGGSSAAACCLQSTSRLDNLLNPTVGSDEEFFTAPGGPPNVMFVLDTSCSMADWPSQWPSIAGCPAVNPAGDYTSPTSGVLFGGTYNPATTYKPMWSNLSNPDTNWFDSTKSYIAGAGGFGQDFEHQPRITAGSGSYSSLNYVPGFNAGNAGNTSCDSLLLGLAAIASLTGNAALHASDDCKTCLATNGWYSFPKSGINIPGYLDWWGNPVNIKIKGVGTGNFFNYYGPRDAGMVNAVSHIIHDLSSMRFGMHAYSATGGGVDCWGGSGEVCTFVPMGPNCDKSFPFDASASNSQRNSILEALNKQLDFGADTPSADSLYAAGFYLHGYTKDENSTSDPFKGWFTDYPDKNWKDNFDSNFEEDNGAGGNNHAICFACSFNSIIFLTDGNPHNEGQYIDIPSEIANQTGVSCPSCAPNKVDWQADRPSLLPHVAKWFWEHDMRSDMPGVQKIATYTIGYSETVDSSVLLKKTAEYGGGQFYGGTTSADLEEVLTEALSDISDRALGFSSSAVPALQTSRATIGAVIPRVLPSRDAQWTGQLWRFDIYNEFVQDNDLNGNGNKDDVFIVDADNDIVTEDPSTGAFIKQATSAPANPHWEASNRLLAMGHNARKLWTVLDNSGDNLLTDADSLVPFTAANAATIGPYLGILGTSFCPATDNASPPNITVGDLLSKLNLSIATASTDSFTATTLTSPYPTQSELNTLCTKVLIQWIRGQDLADENADGSIDDTRLSVMGDIFHSSPVTIDPPIDPFLCELGISPQCIRTLYSDKIGTTPTPQDTYNDKPACNGAGGTIQRNAYDEWAYINRGRTKTVVVGANDGMIHAFNNGQPSTDNCGSGNTVNVVYDFGTGNEVWAFIPPDQLPKLADHATQPHEYYVDGDIMVRDIWADGSGLWGSSNQAADNKKQWQEFHTMIIAAEGRGGNHFIALELLPDGVTGSTPADRPGFRWMFPQPCSAEATEFGKTFYSLAPKAPPIGPVLLDTSSGIAGLGSNPVSRQITNAGTNPVPTTERWIAALSGGWSPSLDKGRGIYLVDAFFGQVNNRNDNIWFKWEYDDTDTSTTRQFMQYSIAAPISLVDYDANQSNHNGDGFFDTAVVGDTGGQIWVARFYQPGKATSGGLITNWGIARGFQMAKSVAGDEDIRQRNPFFYIPSVVAQPDNGAMRVYMGSGNRYALLENNAGTCRFDNPLACAKYSCNFDAQMSVARDTVKLDKSHTHWDGFNAKTQEWDRHASAVAMNACDNVTATYDKYTIKGCDLQSGGGDFGDNVIQPTISCTKDTFGNYSCVRSDNHNDKTDDLFLNPKTDDLDHLGLNRFYGMWLYGGGDTNHQFDETSSTSIMAFDTNRLTDRGSGLIGGGNGDLRNATSASCDNVSCTCSGGGTACIATSDEKGWFLEYLDSASNYPLNNSAVEASLKHKTASGSTVLASCVLWNSIFPAASSATGACSQTSVSKARLFQADVFTGAPNCASGFYNTGTSSYNRYVERSVVAPPTQPGDAPQISKTGQIKYGVMSIEPGGGQPLHEDVSVSTEPFQAVYELPISRGMHNCRHNDPNSCRPMSP